MATKLQRTIYIGAGGTGIETIAKVRNYFKGLGKGKLPPMIKFLFIDTDENTISNIDNTIEYDEVLCLAERHAKAIYLAHKDTYQNYPNKDEIRALTDGAGQFRSLGRFALMCKEHSIDFDNSNSSFSNKFSNLYSEIKDIKASENRDFETLGNDIEVHIAFSMSGGTGAGTFLSMAYLIRKIAPACKIVAYAFAPSFFANLPISSQIQQNTYASLLELDYCMSADNEEYQDVKYPYGETISRAPFDIVMYIDNKTLSDGGKKRPHTYTGDNAKDQVEQSVAYAMAMTAGDVGSGNRSVLDNWTQAIMGKNYDVPITDTNSNTKLYKKAWVSGLGVSEIKCEPNAEQTHFINRLSLRILKILGEKGKAIDSASSIAYSWIKDLDLNENGGNEDVDPVINIIINPDEFMDKPAREINQRDIDSGYNKYCERIKKSFPITTIEQRKNRFVAEKQKELLDKVHQALFGSGVECVSIADTMAITNQFAQYLDEYSSILSKEIDDLSSNKSQAEEDWERTASALKDITSTRIVIDRSNKISSLERDLREWAQKRIVNDTNILRRKEAIDAFNKISAFARNIKTKLEVLYKKVIKAESIEEDKIRSLNTTPVTNVNNWGTIDLTQKVTELPIDINSVIVNMSNLFKLTGYTSVLDFSTECDNLTDLVESYAETLFDNESASRDEIAYPIIRVLKSLNSNELSRHLKTAALYSTPLLEVQKYGEDVKTTQYICIAIPNGVNADPELQDAIKEALDTNIPIKWVDINDPNRILIYRQIGVVPPYFIDGISKGRNSINFYGSCQEAFESKDITGLYCPFTDTQFDNIYHKFGFRLDSNKRDTSESLLLWIKAMILNLIIRDESGYKIESQSGELDMNDANWRSFKSLGANRADAFIQFSTDDALQEEIAQKVHELLKDELNEQKWKKYSSNRKFYGDDFIDRQSEEWQIPAVKKQCESEMKAL